MQLVSPQLPIDRAVSIYLGSTQLLYSIAPTVPGMRVLEMPVRHGPRIFEK